MSRTNNYRMRNRRRRRRGAALVEFSLVAGIFFMLVFTAIELARVNMMRNLVQDAAYYAARKAIVPGASQQDAIAEAQRILGIVGTRNATITINNGSALGKSTEEVIVDVSVPLAANSLVLPHVVNKTAMTARAVMRTERYDNYFDGT